MQLQHHLLTLRTQQGNLPFTDVIVGLQYCLLLIAEHFAAVFSQFPCHHRLWNLSSGLRLDSSCSILWYRECNHVEGWHWTQSQFTQLNDISYNYLVMHWCTVILIKSSSHFLTFVRLQTCWCFTIWDVCIRHCRPLFWCGLWQWLADGHRKQSHWRQVNVHSIHVCLCFV